MIRKILIYISISSAILVIFLQTSIAAGQGWIHYYHGYSYRNCGRSLVEVGTPESSFLGLYYELAPEDSVTIGNIAFLREEVKKIPAYRDTTRFVKTDRRYKLVTSDSAFISVYTPNWTGSTDQSLFILNELTSGKRFLLENFNIDDFNSYLEAQKLKKPYDYLSLAYNYVVLTNIQKNIYFVNSTAGLFEAFHQELESPNQKEVAQHISQFEKRLGKTKVETDGFVTKVTIFVCYADDLRIDKLEFTFDKCTLIDLKTTEILSKSEFMKVMGIHG